MTRTFCFTTRLRCSGFQENSIIIPITAVIEEVDRFKKDMNETGRNARQISRYLDDLRQRGSLSSGVSLDSGGTVRVALFNEEIRRLIPPELNEQRADNRILAIALDAKSKSGKVPVILVTKDTNLRIKADAVGLKAEDYESDKVSIEELYIGFCPDGCFAGDGGPILRPGLGRDGRESYAQPICRT